MKKKPFIPEKVSYRLGNNSLYGPTNGQYPEKINHSEIQQIGPRKLKIREVEVDLDEYDVDVQPYTPDTRNIYSNDVNALTGKPYDSTITFHRYTKQFKSQFLVINPFGESNSKRKLSSDDISVKDLKTNKIHKITLRDFFQVFITDMLNMQFEAEVKEVFYNGGLVIRPVNV